MSYKSALLMLVFYWSVAISSQARVWASIPFQDTPKATKKKTAVGKFIYSIFHHNDSAKQARKFIHQHHKLLKDKQSSTFIETLSPVKAVAANTPHNFQLKYEVLGWYPYWEKDYYKKLNLSLLTTVAYFSYEVNPKTGDPISVHDWETTPFIDTLKTKGKRVLLTVSNFGLHNNKRFLKNTSATEVLIANLIKLLKKRGAHGVCIDFEGVSKNEKTAYTNFLLTLSNRLKQADKNYQIYMTVPNVNWSDAIDFKAINQAIDCFVIMGYDYYGKESKVAGPVAPMASAKTWEPFNLTTTVDYYTKNLPSTKILLALPTYGSLWETKDLNLQSKVKKFLGSRTFSYIKTNIEKNEAVYIEPISKSAYSVYAVKGKKTTYRQCWFENATSYEYKTQLIKDKKLRGLGIWALGYAKGYSDYWDVIAKQLGGVPTATTAGGGLAAGGFAGVGGGTGSNGLASNTANGVNAQQSPTVVSAVVNTLGLRDPNSKINRVEKKLVTVTNYKTILLYVMSFVIFFACVGFVIAMFSANTRNNFFNNAALKKYYAATVLVLLIVVFRMQNWITNGNVHMIIGFVTGAYAFYLINKYIEEKQKDLP